MVPIKNNLTIMFFTPHPDDIELGVPFMFIEALRLGFKVIEVVMTGGEFGTPEEDFKGNRLKKIRVRELDNANKIFEESTNNKVNVIRMGYIDGFLPLHREAIQRVTELIRKEKPDIIFTTDPVHAQDFHEDHLNTGRLVYFSLKKLKKSEHPKRVFYYYSTKTNFYLKCKWKDFKIVKNALIQHQSQYSPLGTNLIIAFYNKLSIFRHLLERRGFSESFREQKIKNGKPIPPKKLSFLRRIIYYTFSTVTIWGYTKLLPPEELDIAEIMRIYNLKGYK